MADTNLPPTGATADRPWLGLAHFTAADRDYFYGREEEVRHLADRVRRTPLVILYGVSGYGKSSLLGAGLIPSLEEAGFTVNLMRRCYEALSLRPLVDDVIAEVMACHPGARPGPDGKVATLWEFFHHLDQPWFQAGAGETTARPVLVFDQFEEIFTRGEHRQTNDKAADLRAREHARDFLEQLSDLIENRPPAALRSLLESGTAEERRTILSRYDFDARPVRCVLALRDDFLAHLERWRRAMPSMMEHRVELQLLSGAQALEAVFKPGTKRPGQPPIIPREAAEAIVRRVAQLAPGVPLRDIQAVPSLLSLLCEQLNSTRLGEEDPAPQIGTAEVEHRSTHILQQFYQECFASFSGSDRETVRSFVEDGMISESGHRHPVAREVAEQQLRKAGVAEPAAAFDELIGRRLLSVEEQKGATLLEITHDVLVPLMLESRTERQERWRKEEQERELAAEREKLAAAALKARRRLWLAIAMSVLMFVAAASAILGFVSWRQAAAERDKARYHEGLAWMFQAKVAQERGEDYPGMLLYPTIAIGFEGAGRGAGDDAPLSYLTAANDPTRHHEAKERLANLPSYLPVWSSPPGAVPFEALDVSPSGRYLAAGGKDGQVSLWDFAGKGPERAIQGVPSQVTDLAFTPDETGLIVATDRQTSTWSISGSGGLEGPSHAAASAVGSGSHRQHLAFGRTTGDLAIRAGDQEAVLATGSPTPASRISLDRAGSLAVAIVPEQGVLVFFSDVAAPVNAWMPEDWNRRDRQGTWPCKDATAAAVSPDGRYIVIGNRDGLIDLWDAATATKLDEMTKAQSHRGPVRDLAFRPDGLELASASDDGRIKIWKLAPGHPKPSLAATLNGHSGPVYRLRYLPGGTLLASGGQDGTAKLWNVSDRPSGHRDLYRYVREQWYQPSLAADLPQWGGKSGFINLPEGSVPSLWQQQSPQAGVVSFLQSSREWPGVAALLPVLPGPERQTVAEAVAAGLAEAGIKASGERRWNLVRMQLDQWQHIGRPANQDLERLEREVASLAREGSHFTNGDGMELVWCPADTFRMGRAPRAADSGKGGTPQKEVSLTQGFWIGKHEVTQAQWVRVTGLPNPSEYEHDGRHPVQRIDWNDAMAFCRQLTDRERARGILPAGWEYTLPSEAQWEYACRAGSKTAYCYGDDPSQLSRYGNSRDRSNGRDDPSGRPADRSQDDKYPNAAPVGLFDPNAWGIHDMHGNVREWCRDKLEAEGNRHARLAEHDTPRFDPLGEQGINREVRGGSWGDNPRECHSARGFSVGAKSSTPELGMRVVLTRIRNSGASSGR